MAWILNSERIFFWIPIGFKIIATIQLGNALSSPWNLGIMTLPAKRPREGESTAAINLERLIVEEQPRLAAREWRSRPHDVLVGIPDQLLLLRGAL